MSNKETKNTSFVDLEKAEDQGLDRMFRKVQAKRAGRPLVADPMDKAIEQERKEDQRQPRGGLSRSR